MHKLLALDTTEAISYIELFSSTHSSIKTARQLRDKDNIILELIQAVLSESHIHLKDINGLVYVHGPGSFTGLRISACIIQAFAYAYDLPVLSISKLKILAQMNYKINKVEKIIIGLDALKDDIFLGHYQLDYLSGTMVPLIEDQVVNKDKLIDMLLGENEKTILIGDIWDNYNDIIMQNKYLKKHKANGNHMYQSSLKFIALNEYQKGNFIAPELIRPHYLKEPHIG